MYFLSCFRGRLNLIESCMKKVCHFVEVRHNLNTNALYLLCNMKKLIYCFIIVEIHRNKVKLALNDNNKPEMCVKLN